MHQPLYIIFVFTTKNSLFFAILAYFHTLKSPAKNRAKTPLKSKTNTQNHKKHHPTACSNTLKQLFIFIHLQKASCTKMTLVHKTAPKSKIRKKICRKNIKYRRQTLFFSSKTPFLPVFLGYKHAENFLRISLKGNIYNPACINPYN